MGTKDSEIQLSNTVIAQLPYGIFWVNEEGKVLQVNESLSNYLGYSPEGEFNKSILEMDTRLSLFTWRKLWKQLKDESPLIRQSDYLTAKGLLIPVKVILCLVRQKNEDLILGFVENLLERDVYKNLLEITSKQSKVGGFEIDLIKEKLLVTNEVYNILKIDKSSQVITYDNYKRFFPVFLSFPQREEFFNQLNKNIPAGKPVQVEYKTRELQGGPLWIRISINPVINEEEVIKVYGTIQDITQLDDSSEFRRLATHTLSVSSEMFFWIGSDGSFQFVNEAACKNLKYTLSELMGRNIWDIVQEMSEQKWNDDFKSIRANQYIYLETLQICKDGTTIPTETNLSYLDFDGKEYVCAIAHNVSKKKAKSEMLYLTQLTVEKARDKILWIEPDQGKILYVNESTCQTLGYSREELVNMHIYDVDPSTNLEKFKLEWEEVKEHGNRLSEGIFRTKSGKEFEVEMRYNYLKYEDKEMNCVFVRNISKRKRKERELVEAIEQNKASKRQLEIDYNYLHEQVSVKNDIKNIISESPRYTRILHQVEEVANTDATVLITGETGTGKELLARAIHELSERSYRPLVKVNCAAISNNLIESELFGHEKGAFTGAYRKKIGRFELADAGTLFLDEVGEIPLELQPKLLRVLQEGEFERLGGIKTIQVDVRIIAATNRKLLDLIKKNKFREDLYYRLNVFPIENIPLRERKEDIPLLIHHFVKMFSKKMGTNYKSISPKLMNTLQKYDYPGNIRELENIIERAMILSKGNTIGLTPGLIADKGKSNKGKMLSFDEMQKKYIIEALKRCNWVVSGKNGAAQLLSLNPKTLESKMRKFGIRKKDLIK